jgi:hypothetical protein
MSMTSYPRPLSLCLDTTVGRRSASRGRSQAIASLTTRPLRVSLPAFTMPTPGFFSRFSSKDSSKDSPDASPDATPAVPAKEIPPETPTITDPDVPQYSDAIREAWSAANVELPQARGVEKFLNNVGM